MTESMIEKVAEALMKVPLEEKNSDYYALARAAIEAMRKPTDLMVEDGAFVSLDGDDIIGRRRAKDCYAAMIDAALQWPPGSADRAGVPMAEE